MYKQISGDIAQEYYQQNFPNDGQRFVAWYLRNIHLRDPIQTRDDITDGADDKQIDAVFVDDDKATIFVIQGKFIGMTCSPKTDPCVMRVQEPLGGARRTLHVTTKEAT